MAVTGSDLHWYLSAAGASEGGARSATEITDNVDNNVFPDIGEIAAIAGGSMTRKIFLANEDGVDPYVDHGIWILTDPTESSGFIGLGFDDADDDDLTVDDLVDVGAAGPVALVSNGSDTRVATVCGIDDATGDPIAEDVTLDGTNEVQTSADFSTVYAIHLSAVSGSRTVTAKDGPGGSSMGTLAPGAVNLFRWLAATSKSTGLRLPSLPTGQADGIMLKVEWAINAGAVDGNTMALKTETL